MNRRKFSQHLLTTVSGFAFMDALVTTEAFARPVKPLTDQWLRKLQEYCGDLRKATLSPIEWQDQISALYTQIDLSELLEYIHFEQLVKGFQYPDLGVATKGVRFPRLSGLPENLAFIRKVFGMKKDRSIIPHGHSNMASAHLILKGQMHMRHYDKLSQEENHLIIQPTVDKIVAPGDFSSISDDKDNVHWFIAETETAFTFDVIVLDLHEQHYDIHNLDIYEQQKQGDGSLRVPILDVQTALKKYGKETHH